MVDRPEVARLRSLSQMGSGELRSRANAIPELLSAIAGVMPLLDQLPIETNRESSPELVSLAQRIWREGEWESEGRRDQHRECKADYNALLADAKRLAGSVISQSDPRDNETAPLPLDDPATRALIDAQTHGQAHPLTRTVEIGPDSTGPKG